MAVVSLAVWALVSAVKAEDVLLLRCTECLAGSEEVEPQVVSSSQTQHGSKELLFCTVVPTHPLEAEHPAM